MNKPSMLQLVVPALAVALGLGPVALAQHHDTKGTKPPNVLKTTFVDLAEFEGMGGRQLRMRVVRVEPGAGHPEHDHKDRPEVAYVVQGTMTDSRGGKATQLRPGDTWTAGKDTTHALRNDGSEPVTLVVVDVFKPR